jgi:hypothetical protein
MISITHSQGVGFWFVCDLDRQEEYPQITQRGLGRNQNILKG